MGAQVTAKLARCRWIAGGDWAAGMLLYRLVYRWEYIDKKLVRFNKDWIAMSRTDWAREAGL